MALELFHPVVVQWFQSRFTGPTEPQIEGWPHIYAGRNVLIAAPTGSGKTLTAFLSAIDRLLRLAEAGELSDEIRVVYISPLRALTTRRSLSVDDVRDLGRLDAAAIAQVIADAQPLVRNADEVHDTLLSRILLPVQEGVEWSNWFRELASHGRATMVTFSRQTVPEEVVHSVRAWAATERVPAVLAAFPDSVHAPDVHVPQGVRSEWDCTEARVAMVRGLLEICGPVTTEAAAARIGITVSQTDAALEALEALEGEGIVLRGRFTPPAPTPSDGASVDESSLGDDQKERPTQTVSCPAPEYSAVPETASSETASRTWSSKDAMGLP